MPQDKQPSNSIDNFFLTDSNEKSNLYNYLQKTSADAMREKYHSSQTIQQLYNKEVNECASIFLKQSSIINRMALAASNGRYSIEIKNKDLTECVNKAKNRYKLTNKEDKYPIRIFNLKIERSDYKLFFNNKYKISWN